VQPFSLWKSRERWLEIERQKSDINLKPIGTVRNTVRKPPKPPYDWDNVVSRIEIEPELTEALDNLDEFSHIIVLFWMDRLANKPLLLKIRPRHDPNRPLVGLFASRAPKRPNPIGETTVRLLKREGNLLTVSGLDALDGTPVIDIKPYLPNYDATAGARTPIWLKPHSKS
jgi:tRNA-Thr(GGU) m(6)t(6)A37 methyltransferase TsaA